MTNNRRKVRLESLIQKEISSYLLKDVKNPNIGFVSILNVELNRDFSMAKVYFSVFGDEEKQKASFKALKSAASYIQYLLGKNLRIRTIPQLQFQLSDSLQQGDEMVNRLANLENDKT